MPVCIRSEFARIQTQALAQISRSHASGDEQAQTSAWTLFLLLPRMLLHSVGRGGAAGARELQKRIRLFDAGQWGELIQASRRSVRHVRGADNRSAEQQLESRLRAAAALIHQGEFSHAARLLQSNGVAPGTADTLQELRNPPLRPQERVDPIPGDLLRPRHDRAVELDPDTFAEVLGGTRKGLSAGLGGHRYEYFKLCLEDDEALRLLTAAAQHLAQAAVPAAVVSATELSSITALLKDNGRIRGIAAGDTFRRLVSKALARQFSTEFRAAVSPANFGLSDRSGTHGLVHLPRSLAEMDPSNTIINIDGVGAFDHVSRARIMTEIAGHPGLCTLVPFLRLWYEDISTIVWTDETGTMHDIPQAEGGEQGDALMPALFCMALRPALVEIQAGLPAGDLVTAYLDDIYVVTKPERARWVYDIVQETLWRVCVCVGLAPVRRIGRKNDL